MTYDVILERLTRKPRRKRAAIAQPKLLDWVQSPDPELSLSDLADFSRSRIEDLDELLRKINRRDGGNNSRNMTTGGLPYNTLEAFGDTMQSRSNAGSDDENPMTVF